MTHTEKVHVVFGVLAAMTGVLALWHDSAPLAYAVAFGLSAGQVFFSPAAQSLLPSVVDEDELVAANSGIWTAAVTTQVLVAPVAALVAVNVGFGPAFATPSAGSFRSGRCATMGAVRHDAELPDPCRTCSICPRTRRWRAKPTSCARASGWCGRTTTRLATP